ncbi:ABC transporter ATP-binding protein [Paenibacillus dendritiformis]|uniref:ABC transporter ATP-binding protein n=2 Tax=Paenibacillus dendritiformis TaxID=130049 RepID=UPI001B2FE371|nr:ABC transporter ATP-binding protein [Paenibacillus dendritiformis]
MMGNAFGTLFHFVWKYGKVLLVVTSIITIFIAIMPVVILWLSKETINEVARLIQHQSENYNKILFLLLLQFLITMLTSIFMNIQEYLNGKLTNMLEHASQSSVIQKVTNVPLFYFDLPDFYNHLERVSNSPGDRLLSPLSKIMEICRIFITIFGYLLFLLTVHWSLVLLSLLAAAPMFLVQKKYGKKNFALKFALTPLVRDMEYTRFLLKDRQSAKEIRLFGLSSLLYNRWSSAFLHQLKETLRMLRKRQRAEIGMDGLTALFYSGAAAIIIWLIRTTPIQIGQFVAIGQAVQGTQGLTNQLSTLLAKVFEEMLYVNDFFRFLNYSHPEAEKQGRGNVAFSAPLQKGITIDNVSFSYVDTTTSVLKNIQLHIEPGEKVAIVGENGSGKSTLVKCLMGLYPVTKGEIRFDDVSIDQLDPDQLHKNITAIFQDFLKYSYTLRDNIGFGDVTRLEDMEWMREVAATTGVDAIARGLKEEYATYLGRYLQEGEDLSGGQWQKIALARALFRQSDIIILDEPTAALDPLTELEVYKLVRDLTENKTAIFISHRMAAARMADRIIVMEKGTITESGTHKELMALNGKYAQMYESQAQWYV